MLGVLGYLILALPLLGVALTLSLVFQLPLAICAPVGMLFGFCYTAFGWIWRWWNFVARLPGMRTHYQTIDR
jgi:hypothetical protein